MDHGRILGDEGLHGTRDADALRELRPLHESVAVTEAEAPVLGKALLEGRHPLRTARDQHLATTVEARVDPSLHTGPAHLVHGVVRGLLHPAGGVRPVQSLEARHGDVEIRGAPGAVAAGGPESRDLPLDDHDPQRGVALGEVVAPSTARSCLHPGSPRRRPRSRRAADAASGRRGRSRANRRWRPHRSCPDRTVAHGRPPARCRWGNHPRGILSASRPATVGLSQSIRPRGTDEHPHHLQRAVPLARPDPDHPLARRRGRGLGLHPHPP